MKVIKKVDTNAWSHRVTCRTCESELEVSKGDIKYQYHSGYGRDPDYETWKIQCPVCQTEIGLVSKDIPPAVRAEIKTGKLPSVGTVYVDQFEDARGKLPRDGR